MKSQRQIDAALRRNLKRRSKEPGFDPIAYKRKWYEVGRKLREKK